MATLPLLFLLPLTYTICSPTFKFFFPFLKLLLSFKTFTCLITVTLWVISGMDLFSLTSIESV